MAELKKPVLPPPINVAEPGQIKVIVSGKITVKSSERKVVIERKP